MSLFYESFYINTTGIITETKIPLSADGKVVHFDFDGNELTKKLFMVIDKKITPFDNNTKMETPVKGFNRLYQFTPHEGSLIAIDIGTVDMTVDSVSLATIPFTVNAKQSLLLLVTPSINLSFGIYNPEQLAVYYCEGRVRNPMNNVKNAVTSAFNKAAKEIYSSAADRYRNDPMSFVGNLNDIADDMSEYIITYVNRELPWARIDGCTVNITASNTETIVSLVNEPYEITKAILERFVQAICDSYKTPVFPPEMAQVLGAYVSANPGGLTHENLEKICEKLVNISRRASPNEMLFTAKKIGLLV